MRLGPTYRRNRLESANEPPWWIPSATGLTWAILDFLTVIAAGFFVFLLRSNDALLAHSPTGRTVSLVSLCLFGVYLVSASSIYGLYPKEHPHYGSGVREQGATLQAAVTAVLLLCGTLYLLHAFYVSRLDLLLTWVLTLTMLMSRRYLWRRVVEKRFLSGLETRNILIVGDDNVAQELRHHLDQLRHMGFRFKGFISPLPLDPHHPPSQIIGDLKGCIPLARSLFVDEVYFSSPPDKDTLVSIIEEAREVGIEVRVIPELYDGLAARPRVEFIGQFPTIQFHRREFTHHAYLVKRLIDVVVSFVSLLLLAPILVLISALVRMNSPGPIFYRAQRIGRKGRQFTCFKFRTMVMDADQRRAELIHLNERDDVLFKISDDPRITRVGVYLRKYSLDELPQLINVLIGDMSLVGPRPPIASEVEQYEMVHLRRLDVLPGITGLWQVQARQDPSFASYISLDISYVENWSVLLDVQILIRTIGVVLHGTGS